MLAKEVKQGYQVKWHGNWQMVDMILRTWVSVYPETSPDESRRFVLACGCTIEVKADDEMECRNGSGD